MAQRLPVPGSDDNTWGDILNGFLGVSFNGDGTLKTGVVTATQIADGAITTTDISSTAGITKAQLETAVQTSLGKADLSAADAAVVHLAGAETVPGAKTFSSKIVASGSIQIGSSSALNQVWTAIDTSGNGSWQTFSNGYGRSVQAMGGATNAGATASTDYVYYWTGSAVYALTMPTAVGNTNRYTLKNGSTSAQSVVAFSTTPTQYIEGTATITIAANNSVDLISNGANWMVI